MDTDFWDRLIGGLGYSDLEWLEIRIRRHKESMHPEKTTRHAIIRKL